MSRALAKRVFMQHTDDQSVGNAVVAFFKGANERNEFFEKKKNSDD